MVEDKKDKPTIEIVEVTTQTAPAFRINGTDIVNEMQLLALIYEDIQVLKKSIA